jgi:hypothetical protein
VVDDLSGAVVAVLISRSNTAEQEAAAGSFTRRGPVSVLVAMPTFQGPLPFLVIPAWFAKP